MKRKREDTRIIESTGNVFADLGLENADELLAKAEMVRQISAIIKARRLTQIQAGKLLGLPQPGVSRLLRGQLEGFSTERLLRFLTSLNCDVDVVVRRRRASTPGQLRVRAA